MANSNARNDPHGPAHSPTDDASLLSDRAVTVQQIIDHGLTRSVAILAWNPAVDAPPYLHHHLSIVTEAHNPRRLERSALRCRTARVRTLQTGDVPPRACRSAGRASVDC